MMKREFWNDEPLASVDTDVRFFVMGDVNNNDLVQVSMDARPEANRQVSGTVQEGL